MKTLKFKLKNARKFGWKGLKGLSYSSNEDFKGASAAMFEVTGRHGKVKSLISNRSLFGYQRKRRIYNKWKDCSS